MDVLADIQKWYASNCDENWEHSFGVTIETLDNPGWCVTIDLEDTKLEGKNFETLQEELSEAQWIHCSVKEKKFLGSGDETKLEEILNVFLVWAKSQNEDWLKPPKPISDEEEDEEFIKILGEETGKEVCKTEGCTHKRIKNSVMCRRHHFEMYRGRPFPEDLT